MSVDSFERGYVSDDLVARMAWDQSERLDMAEGSPTLGVVLGFPTAANESYALQVLRHGESLASPTRNDGKAPVELYIPTADGFTMVQSAEEFRDVRGSGLYMPMGKDEARNHDGRIVELIQDMNANPNITGELPLLRAATSEGDKAIRAAVDVHKDVDGVSPDRIVTPATPESQVTLAEDILGTTIDQVDPRYIGIIGNGPLVGGPLYKEVLPKHGVDTAKLGAVFGTREEIQEGIPTLSERDIRVIFTAIPVAGLIRRGCVSEDGTVIIDAGYGIDPETSQPLGNIHPELLALNGLKAAGAARPNAFTSFRGGVGPVTAAIVYDRAIPPRTPGTNPLPTDQRFAVVGA